MEIDDKDRTPCECWTRVMGYFRPFSHFNKGKKSEFKERVWFTEAKARPSSRPCKGQRMKSEQSA